ncbi:hypothetical protein N0V84_003379 [Fusarium piperis]|uniref:Gfd2/YDR514C-like C-terminal domain-containing protein n=1 Tax=Fusarium piperis TaxID=1435070 RepID=A0A9W8WHG6_9HYPO|nr:hypothetical protein N0V84_003379 [Fusarium piperis]
MADLDGRLERLQHVLGQEVKMVERKKDTEKEEDVSQVESGNDRCVLDDDWPNHHQLSGAGRDHTTSAAEELAMGGIKSKAFDCSDFRVGEPVDDPAFEFCPFKIVLTYPERFIGKMNRPKAKPFFAQPLTDRVWDFFYIHDPDEPTRDPYLLVPTAQFQAFLDDINLELGISLKIPLGVNTERFYMQFNDLDTPRPRYLRRSQDETSLDIRPWPTINDDDVENYQAAGKEERAEWRDKLKLVKTGFIPKQRNSFKALFNKRNRDLMLKHTQEYLGLVGNPEGHDVVFICVDVEAIERPPNPVSEIGFAILDTRDIQGIAPGECGRGWWPKIRCHHLRVKEYAGLRNYRYVKGCPNAFNFGKSTFPTKAKTKDAILAVLDPYMKDSRNIAIVGHDINQDIKYLKSLGIDIEAATNAYPPVDTKDIHQSWTNSNNGRGLSSVLLELGIASKNLHNAGNDAYYTLCAMIGIAIEGAKGEDEKSDMNNVE